MWHWQQLCESGVETSARVQDSVVVDHIHAQSRCYIGSPSLVSIDRDRLVCSHDFFGPGSTWNRSEIFLSNDRGSSWMHVSSLEGQWWSNLFVHDDALYLMGTSREWGAAVIRRSDDDGRTWSVPEGADRGLLLPAGRYHCAPVPVLRHRGRLWRAMEDAGPEWRDFRAFVMSAPTDADPLRADSWTSTNRLRQDKTHLGGHLDEWAEGNVVVGPEGTIVDVLRVFAWSLGAERAALVKVEEDGAHARFDPETGFVPMPGGGKKFTLRWDPASSRYWSLTNHVPDPEAASMGIRSRNSLCLVSSPDLRDWEVHGVLLHHAEDAHHAFQYADWIFDGNDILFVARTAADDGEGGAHSYHDANYLTFHRLTSFRTMWRPE